jgi:hypothetical protein
MHRKSCQCRRESAASGRRPPIATVAGLVAAGLFVGFAIWAWPEVHRTIRIHRM